MGKKNKESNKEIDIELRSRIDKYIYDCRRWTVSGNNVFSILNTERPNYSLAADLANILLCVPGAFSVQKSTRYLKKTT